MFSKYSIPDFVYYIVVLLFYADANGCLLRRKGAIYFFVIIH